MRLRLFSALALSVLSLVAISAGVAQKEQRYSSLQVDAKGQLHIFTDSGREIVPARIKSQVSFGKPAISPDHLMVGWTVEYDDSDAIGVPYDPIAGDLVLFRNGQVVHRFHAEQLLWDWKFVEGGRRVAYTDGPLHGNPTQCVLRDVQSGRLIKRWFFDEKAELPAWASGIRCNGV
jgi:hypothetical protein